MEARVLLVVFGLLLVAFVPVLVHLLVVRALHRGREPWRLVLKAFAWGATGAVAVSVTIGMVGLLGLGLVVGAAAGAMGPVFLAPPLEEGAKALGLRWVRAERPRAADGALMGAAAGLGFAGTENLVYGAYALLEDGPAAYAEIALVRAFVSALMHAGAASVLGATLWRFRGGGRGAVVAGGFMVAVGLHMGFNLLLISSPRIGFLLAIVVAWTTFTWTMLRIRGHDAPVAGD